MIQRRDTALFIFLIILCISLLSGLTWMNYQYSTEEPGGNDFLTYWMAAKLWLEEGVNPYSEEVSLASQQIIYGRTADPSKGEDQQFFVYPLFAMIFIAPFSLLDYTLARALWMTLLEIALVLVAILSLQITRWRLKPLGIAGVLLFSILWYCGLRTLILGAISGIIAVIILGVFVFIQKNRDVDAGLLLALSLAKPQMSFLLIIFILIWSISVKRYRVFTSFWITALVLIVGSTILLPDWPTSWLRDILIYADYTGKMGPVISNLASNFPGIQRPLEVILNGVVIVYLLTEWFVVWRRDQKHFLWTALLTLVVTNLIAFRTATPHYVLLLPAFFLTFKLWQERWGIKGQIATWAFLSFLLFGLWFLFIRTIDGNIEDSIMYLPVPILSLLMLWWSRGLSSRLSGLPFVKVPEIG